VSSRQPCREAASWSGCRRSSWSRRLRVSARSVARLAQQPTQRGDSGDAGHGVTVRLDLIERRFQITDDAPLRGGRGAQLDGVPGCGRRRDDRLRPGGWLVIPPKTAASSVVAIPFASAGRSSVQM
jgi:hypothetical protein